MPVAVVALAADGRRPPARRRLGDPGRRWPAGSRALLFSRGAGGRIRWTLEQAGGCGRIRLGRVLGVAGICVALSASIAVGFYELLLRLEG